MSRGLRWGEGRHNFRWRKCRQHGGTHIIAADIQQCQLAGLAYQSCHPRAKDRKISLQILLRWKDNFNPKLG